MTIMKSDHDALKRMDNFAGKNDNKVIDYFKDEAFTPGTTIKKFKSLNMGKMNALVNNKNNEVYNSNPNYFNNSCTLIMSPKCNNTNYSFKKDGNIKSNRNKNENNRNTQIYLSDNSFHLWNNSNNDINSKIQNKNMDNEKKIA